VTRRLRAYEHAPALSPITSTVEIMPPTLTSARYCSSTSNTAPIVAVNQTYQFSSESAARMTSSTYTPSVKPATPLTLGLVGNVAHWSRKTIGMSSSATARAVNGATRGSRRLAQKTTAAVSQ